MYKIILFAIVVLFCSVTLFAQNLSVVTVKDQFDSGERGGNLALTNGAAEYYSFETISNTAGATGTIVYVNAFAGQASKAGEVESPILGVTSTNLSPDRSFNLTAIAANSRSGATSPSSALFIGDDGGYNATALGDTTSTNYFLQTDMFCPNNSAVVGAGGTNYTRMGIAIRANYNVVPSVEGPSINTYPTGNYALVYESSITTMFAVKFSAESSATGDMRVTSMATNTSLFQVFAKMAITDNGWHTLKIGASGNLIQFFVDGTQLGGNVFDSTNPFGSAVLFYRAAGTFDNVSATDTQGVFDNLVAGPYSVILPVSVKHNIWTLFN